MPNRVPPPREFNWARTLRTLSFWALLIVGSIALVQFASSRRQEAVEISYTQFTEQLDAANIAAVEITERQQIKGDFKHAVTVGRRSAEHFTTLLPFESRAEWVQTLRDKGVDVRAREEKQSFGVFLFSFLPYLFILGLIIFMLRQMQQGGNRAFAFGKSKAKLLSGDTPKITFADVAGADEAKQELEEIIDFLKDPQKFQRLGGRLPKGALLVGPPGTGKTLLAMAGAGEAGRPFLLMSGSGCVVMFVGVGASRVRDLFEQGKAHAPCTIFIDEIAAVGRHRGAGLGGGHDEREQTLNALLVEMDGFESNEGVILIAATNRPDVLDPALLRPGRFDRRVVVPLPDVGGREGILKVHTKKIPLSEDVDISVLARGSPGFSGADLANLVNEAALLAARHNRKQVMMVDFEWSKDKVLMGAERKSLILSEEEKKNTAFHEAGHALVAAMVPYADPLHKVTIIPRGMALGVTAYLPEGDRHTSTKDYLESRLAIMMGGRVAEELSLNHITTGAGNDIEQATELARHMVCEFGMSDLGPLAFGKNQQEIFLGRDITTQRDFSEDTAIKIDLEVKKFVMNAYQRAKDVLSSNRETLVRIAEALLVREVLDAADVKLIIEGKPLPEPVKPRISAPETTEVLKPQPAAPGLAGRERPQPA